MKKEVFFLLLLVCFCGGCNRPEYTAPTATETSAPTADFTLTPALIPEPILPVQEQDSIASLSPFTRENPATDLADVVHLMDQIKAQYIASFNRIGWYGMKAYSVASAWLHLSDPETKAYDGFFYIDCWNEPGSEPCRLRYIDGFFGGDHYSNWEQGVKKVENNSSFDACEFQLSGNDACYLSYAKWPLFIHEYVDTLLAPLEKDRMKYSVWIEQSDNKVSLFFRVETAYQGLRKDQNSSVLVETSDQIIEFDWQTGFIVSQKTKVKYDDGTEDFDVRDSLYIDELTPVYFGESLPPFIQTAYDEVLTLAESIHP